MSSNNNEIIEMMKAIKEDTGKTRSDITDIKEQLNNLTVRVINNEEKMLEIRQTQEETLSIIAQQRNRIEELERRNKKNNIIIRGIQEDQHSLQNFIIDFISSKIQINFHQEHINYIKKLRVPIEGKTRLIILSLTSWTKKREIMENRGRLKGTGIYVSDDLTKEELKTLNEIVKYYKWFRSEGKQVSIRGTRLKVDGELRTLKFLQENYELDVTQLRNNTEAPETIEDKVVRETNAGDANNLVEKIPPNMQAPAEKPRGRKKNKTPSFKKKSEPSIKSFLRPRQLVITTPQTPEPPRERK